VLIKKIKWIALLVSFVSIASSAAENAAENVPLDPTSEQLCLEQLQFVRISIQNWIIFGGATKLALPKAIPLNDYQSKMRAEINEAQLSCRDLPRQREGKEQICESYIDPQGTPQIVCDSHPFMAGAGSVQHLWVHHQYAALSGLEVDDGSGAQFEISNQIEKIVGDRDFLPFDR
jgi:hypothetical protein